LTDYARALAEQGVQRIMLGLVDLDCTLRGKYVSKEKFLSAVEGGLGFCDVIFGWDIADAVYDPQRSKPGFPDGPCNVDFASMRMLPWEPGTALFLLDYQSPVAPREVFRRVLRKVAERGYTPWLSAEFEFFCFRETPETLRAKAYRGLTPLTPGMFGYSVLRAGQNREFAQEMLDWLPVEGLHTETGPGVWEAANAHAEGLEAGDRAALFKTFAKQIAARHGIMPTFMAKVSPDLPGSSGHLHQSLWREGKNLFTGELMNRYIAGLLRFMPELTALFCPTVNSYKRLVPGAWAPVNATWGIDNRTTAVRALPSSGKSARVELRITGADINPYIAMSAALAAGLEGIERGLEPPPPTKSGYDSDAAPLPGTLAEATALLRGSEIARDWLGEEFTGHYAATRDWEVRQFARSVTDWELARYLESI
jgi:glutamine synthetase